MTARTAPLRLAVLASGRGSNLQAILDAIEQDRLHAQVVGVFSDKPNANALRLAHERAIPAQYVDPLAYADRSAFDTALFARVDECEPDLIVCAGFMRILSPAVVEAHAGRMINIHPSLLPRHKGLRTHRQALASGDSEHGASVHLVTAELDGGPVLAQARICIDSDDTEESLAARVLRVEHPLLIACLNEWQRGYFRYAALQLLYRERVLECPLDYEYDSDSPLAPF
ncbi:phosphoribosylglycinamide formyltransferase [Aquilutibacter rugosus]|uniref:phosphoribosylglycinamide formyltransferase n=1 Tax=Aquilutibacter rugosus TaxID=3115820 RepID=UPI002F411B8E